VRYIRFRTMGDTGTETKEINVMATLENVSKKEESKGIRHTAKIAFYLLLWYALNVFFNIYNKKALNVFPAPWTLATFQLFSGFFIFIPLWILGIRKAPSLTKDDINRLKPVAGMHTLGHVSGIVALGAGAVSFTHIVKSLEPLFTALFGIVLYGQYFAFPVYLSLLPVCAGVSIAALKELSFTWTALSGAMASNVACAIRGLLSKSAMKEGIGENMGPANLFSVLTILAFFMLLPFALVLEGSSLPLLYQKTIADGTDVMTLVKYFGLSGFFFYTYNEVSYMALSLIDPISNAVANTIKRVAIIGVSIVVFKTQMTQMGIIGSAMAIIGVLIYSLVKQYYEKKGKKKN